VTTAPAFRAVLLAYGIAVEHQWQRLLSRITENDRAPKAVPRRASSPQITSIYRQRKVQIDFTAEATDTPNVFTVSPITVYQHRLHRWPLGHGDSTRPWLFPRGRAPSGVIQFYDQKTSLRRYQKYVLLTLCHPATLP